MGSYGLGILGRTSVWNHWVSILFNSYTTHVWDVSSVTKLMLQLVYCLLYSQLSSSCSFPES